MTRAFFLAFAIMLGSLSSAAIPVAHAQVMGSDPLTITLDPEYPKPYQTVTVTVSSTLLDLASSNITISANGAVIEKGSGALSTQVQMGGSGSRTTIKATAVAGGQTYTEQTAVSPADVALVVEPNSTTHPFYLGAALIASEGPLRLVALPDLRTSSGAAIAPANLVYTWKNGDQVLEAQSGIGKSTLVATAPVRYRDATISVTVSTQDSSIVASASTVISPTDPLVRIYQDDPLLGPLFNVALPSSITMTNDEETFRAVPYYFGAAPSLAWAVNGAASETDKDITVRPTGTGSGTAVLTLTANQGSLSQSANSALTVKFGTPASLGIFGL